MGNAGARTGGDAIVVSSGEDAEGEDASGMATDVEMVFGSGAERRARGGFELRFRPRRDPDRDQEYVPDEDEDDSGGSGTDAIMPSLEGGASAGPRPARRLGFAPAKRGKKSGRPGVWTNPVRLGPGMKSLPGREELRDWAKALLVGSMAGQAQHELDVVATSISAAKNIKTTEAHAVRIAIRRASASVVELTGKAEKGENPDRSAREVVFWQRGWEKRAIGLAGQVKTLAGEVHLLSADLGLNKQELEGARMKYARLEARVVAAGLYVAEPLGPAGPLSERSGPPCDGSGLSGGPPPLAPPPPVTGCRSSPAPPAASPTRAAPGEGFFAGGWG